MAERTDKKMAFSLNFKLISSGDVNIIRIPITTKKESKISCAFIFFFLILDL